MASPPRVLRMRKVLRGTLPEPDWPGGVRIKTLDRKDAKEAKAAHAVLAAGYWEGGGGAPNYAAWWPHLRKDREFDPALFFLAFDHEGCVGIVQCWTSNFIKDLAVHPRARRRGVGTALMLTVFEAFHARGAPHVDLKVREENTIAQELYAKLGMKMIGRELA
jgi:ribosomal protein S18 acetylase RimI-like enzyme